MLHSFTAPAPASFLPSPGTVGLGVQCCVSPRPSRHHISCELPIQSIYKREVAQGGENYCASHSSNYFVASSEHRKDRETQLRTVLLVADRVRSTSREHVKAQERCGDQGFNLKSASSCHLLFQANGPTYVAYQIMIYCTLGLRDHWRLLTRHLSSLSALS